MTERLLLVGYHIIKSCSHELCQACNFNVSETDINLNIGNLFNITTQHVVLDTLGRTERQTHQIINTYPKKKILGVQKLNLSKEKQFVKIF